MCHRIRLRQVDKCINQTNNLIFKVYACRGSVQPGCWRTVSVLHYSVNNIVASQRIEIYKTL